MTSDSILKICEHCGEDQADEDVRTCTANVETEYSDGMTLLSLAFEGEGRCPDCNVGTGGKHHFPCPEEECPRCRRLLLFCGCLDYGDAS